MKIYPGKDEGKKRGKSRNLELENKNKKLGCLRIDGRPSLDDGLSVY